MTLFAKQTDLYSSFQCSSAFFFHFGLKQKLEFSVVPIVIDARLSKFILLD